MPQHFNDLYTLFKTCHLPAPAHPLLCAFAFDSPVTAFSEYLDAFTCDFYILAFKKIKAGILLYGRSSYDHQNGTMSFSKPEQLIELQHIELEEAGFLIAFHKDYVLHETIYEELTNYGFFEYETNEALHLSDQEAQMMWNLYDNVETEYYNNEDTSSKPIILSHLLSMLRYANRYYQRQFIHRKALSSSLLTKFNATLRAQLNEGSDTLPTVSDLASKVGLSPRYLSDLLKQETGKTVIEHIQLQLIDKAKNLLLTSDWSIAETAYHLGFDYPTYFARLFKKQTGLSPKAYRQKYTS